MLLQKIGGRRGKKDRMRVLGSHSNPRNGKTGLKGKRKGKQTHSPTHIYAHTHNKADIFTRQRGSTEMPVEAETTVAKM